MLTYKYKDLDIHLSRKLKSSLKSSFLDKDLDIHL